MDSRVSIRTGLYGNVAGTLEGLHTGDLAGIALVVEYSDLDPRLGYREAGSWGPGALVDIGTAVETVLDRIATAVEGVDAGIPIAVSLPSLPLPPLFHTPGWQASTEQIQMELRLLEFASRIGSRSILMNRQRLAEVSPMSQRLDLKSDLAAGLPYTLSHADALANCLAHLLAQGTPKKGLITDLDDTLWDGVVGEVGPQGVSWDLAGHQQIHGLYQKLLASLSEEGVLVAIASKNDPRVVEEALGREDLILKRRHVFPVEVHWTAKSGSVDRILQSWNVGAGSVVFVDDSPMELAEVAAAHPGIECILFPKKSAADVYSMLGRLRDLFGKQRLSAEDAYRLESIRQGAVFRKQDGAPAPESFLEQAGACVSFDFGPVNDPRVLELVNKTNQFNLNGIRHTEADWSRAGANPGSFLAAVSYQDKFGPLGRIAVISGHREGGRLRVNTWVMSCRAFARRIEHQCLKMLYSRYGTSEIVFRFTPTAKNGPLRDFFVNVLGETPEGEFALSRETFELKCPQLYHKVMEVARAESNG